MIGAVTVAVCSRDRPDQLSRCLQSVREALRATDELVVVDSASRSPDTGAVAAAAGARLVRLERPGLSVARNAALDASANGVVAFTDDDCRVEPDWVRALTAPFDDTSVGFATGRVEGEGDGPPVAVNVDRTPHRLDSTTPPERLGHGANFAVRVDAARAAGGFDPLLGAGARFRAAEDSDLLRRLVAAGWCGRYVPDAVVRHHLWRSRRAALATVFGYGVGFGALSAKARAGGDPTVLRRGLGPAGLGRAWDDLRHGYAHGVAASLCWSAGVVVGHARARRLPVHDGRLGARP